MTAVIHPARHGRTPEADAAARRIAERGYHVVYRHHEANCCPGCGRFHWYVGRVSAECAFCGTALPFATATSPSSPGKDV